MNDTNVSSIVLDRLSRRVGRPYPRGAESRALCSGKPNGCWGFDRARDCRGRQGQTQHLSCAWPDRWASTGTRISAPRFAMRFVRAACRFPDRARWLQDIRQIGELGGLYADMVGAAIRNIEETFAGIDAADLKAAAPRISGIVARFSRWALASTTRTRAISPILPQRDEAVSRHPPPRLDPGG